jgi:hypothetical protein
MKLTRIAFIALFSTGPILACGWDPSRPFEREAPEVKEAIKHLDGGDAGSASDMLEEYLTTGQCKEGSIGVPPRVKQRPNGSFDLGLGLFKLAETYGRRFGEEEKGPAQKNDPDKQARGDQIECALRVVRAVGEDPSQPADLRARARYLEGNLLFLNAAYEDAVKAYDRALEVAPGMPEAGVQIGAARTIASDAVGRDAAWNRAIALRRIEDKKDAGQDAQPDANGDGGNGDGGNDNKNGDDAGKDGSNNDDKKDGGNDDQNKQKPPPPPEKQPQTRQNEDDRVLQQLDNAPTVQQEAAKKMRKANPRGALIDK